MSLLKRIKPTLVFDGKHIENQINCLNNLTNLNEEGEMLREKELKFLSIGLYGENQILFELLNSNLPMYIFHDLYYEFEDLNAQIDFLAITEYKIFVIECKNIVGNIIIDNKGSFIREYNGIKEGMYSPITQNERHIDLLINLIMSKQNLLGKFINRNLRNNIDSIITFTNSKTIIKSNYAPKDIKYRVIRADNINSYIKTTINRCTKKSFNIESFAQFFKYYNITKKFNYDAKYEAYKNNTNGNLNIEELREKLKNYRLNLARKENCKPFIIFTNEQLECLLSALPKNENELLKLSGFGKYKVEKYGKDILDIINKGVGFYER